MNNTEILAPAGSFESLVAAINAGADAVYLGGNNFGARAFANNFDNEELLKAIDYVHKYDKKIYLTINTLFKNNEIEQLYSYLKLPYEYGLDAVIVQDVGVLKYVKNTFSDMDLHISTQMTITGINGAKLMKDIGASRIVTARELSFNEIKKIKQATNLEIESFVHGALCYCYSGQCLFSSIIGERSGNRGRCAQPCRQPYNAYYDGKKINTQGSSYLLCPKDLCTIDYINNIIECGVDSLKIEGRMKKPEYVGLVVDKYRQYVDAYYNKTSVNKELTTKDKIELLDIFNRGQFTDGYYSSYNGKHMMSLNRPNHMGVYVGKVEEINKNKISFKCAEEINNQDVLEIVTKGEPVVLTTGVSCKKGNTISINGNNLRKISISDSIYRTKNNSLVNSVQENILLRKSKQIINCKVILKSDSNSKIIIYSDKLEIEFVGGNVEKAKNRPISKDKIIAQLSKTGNSDFEFRNIEVIMDDDIFIPIGELNELRRQAISQYEEKLVKMYHRLTSTDNSHFDRIKVQSSSNKTCDVAVSITSFDQLSIIKEYDFISKIYFSHSLAMLQEFEKINLEIQQHGISTYVILPRIIRYRDYSLVEKLINKKTDGLLISNIEEFAYIRDKKINKEIIFDNFLYAYNDYAVNFYKENFYKEARFILPYELNKGELLNLNIENSEIMVYGHIPLMVSAQCVNKNIQTCDKTGKMILIKDKKNKDFLVKNYCDCCYNIIYNSEPLSLLGNFIDVMTLNPKVIRLDFLNESNNQIRNILENTEFAMKHGEAVVEDYSFTRGHFTRGIK